MKLRYYLRGLGVGIIVTAIIMNIAFSNKQEMSDEEIKARAAELGMIEDTVLAPNQTPTPTAGAAADGQGWTNIVTPTQTDDIAVSHAAGQTTEQPAQGEAASGVPTPTAAITETPMSSPTATPTAKPTAVPTAIPTPTPTATPTAKPTVVPTATPTPTAKPTAAPTATPTPTAKPTAAPTATPTPTAKPTAAPTSTPTPTAKPTAAPTATPTPTAKPTATPTATPTPTQAVQETVTITINSGEGSGTVSRKAAQAGLVADAADFDRYLCANGYDKKLAVGNHIIPVGASYEEIAKKLTSHGN